MLAYVVDAKNVTQKMESSYDEEQAVNGKQQHTSTRFCKRSFRSSWDAPLSAAHGPVKALLSNSCPRFPSLLATALVSMSVSDAPAADAYCLQDCSNQTQDQATQLRQTKVKLLLLQAAGCWCSVIPICKRSPVVLEPSAAATAPEGSLAVF